MQKPTIEQVQAYIIEKNYILDAEAFWYSYESKGWMVGKNPMKQWRGAISNWAVNGWGKTGAAQSDYLQRNAKDYTKEKQRDEYEDYLTGLKPAALEDKIRDPGAMKHVVWLMEEIKQRKALGL